MPDLGKTDGHTTAPAIVFIPLSLNFINFNRYFLLCLRKLKEGFHDETDIIYVLINFRPIDSGE